MIDPAQSLRGATAAPNSDKPGVPLTAEYADGLPTFDFRRYWHSFLERIWIVAICVLAGFFLALGNLARTPKLYQAHTVLEVDFQEPSFVPTNDSTTRNRSVFLASQEALRTIEQNLTNQTLLARVVRSEGLAQDGGRALLGQSVVAKKSSSATERTEPLQADNKTQNASGVTTFTPLEEALGRGMVGMVHPAIRRGTRLIDLYVTHGDPAMAQRLAEAVGREYIRNSIERRASSSEDALRYLLEEEERLKRNLQKSEAAVTEYKEKNPDALQLGGGTAATGSQGAGGTRGGLVEVNLEDINSKLTAARSDQIRLEGQLQQIDQIGDNINALLAIPSISAAPMVSAARNNIIQIEAGITTLALRYKDKHPRMLAAKASLAEAKDKLRQAVLAQRPIMRNTLDQIKATEASLQQALQNQQGVAVNLNRTAIGYQELARQAETDRALYESVLRQIKDTNLAKDVKANAVSVNEHSPLPNFPVSPRPTTTILLGLLGGLAVGLALVFGVDALDRSIKTVDQAENTLGLPVFAAVPDTTDEGAVSRLKRRSKAFRTSNYRVVVETPESPAAEAFRNLRAALSLLGPEAERKVSLFTSAVPSEGKSFTSANYSLALAQQGYRVLLIDGDLRRPNVHKIFRFPKANIRNNSDDDTAPGVTDCLIGEADLASAAREIPAGEIELADENVALTGKILTATGGQLFVLAGGRRAPNPAEILAGPFFGQLIAEATKLFDRVVIDSAPILAVSDTLLMTPHAQTLCIVVRSGKTPRQAVRRAITLLAKSGIRPAGLILNRLRRSRGVGYYYYYASHGYGDGEGGYSRSYTYSRRSKPDHDGNGA
ncbi:MAG TPA: polysaccharide biosynthesis tyrosine autokinase [Candidatus Udaeobacter sp.]|nr:polysaccharide biosynthesis tyrosine autokinase [Candidatus Udaeobacter sp.]